jgi:hypothetical protein
MDDKYYLGVVGGRNFDDYDLLAETIGSYISDAAQYILVSGGAKGADKLVEKYASENGYDMIIYTPDWSKGKRAGPLRNQRIVDKSDEIIAFWDGQTHGTKSTIDLAKKANKTVHVIKYAPEH